MSRVEIYGVTNHNISQRTGISLPNQGFHIETPSTDIFAKLRDVNTASYVVRGKCPDPRCRSQIEKFYDKLDKYSDIHQ